MSSGPVDRQQAIVGEKDVDCVLAFCRGRAGGMCFWCMCIAGVACSVSLGFECIHKGASTHNGAKLKRSAD